MKASEFLNEFAPVGSGGNVPPRGPKTPGKDPWGGNDGPGDDPYSRPEPEYYSRSIDFFGKFEADHFDKEDFNEKTGVFKGYWDYDGELKQIAYFKFDDPQQAARDFNDSPGMGWYYEPQMDEGWSEKYKRSINCSNPKGFSQRAHCQGRKKNEDLEPKDIHNLADKKNVSWDNDPEFMNKSKELTGKKHLDDMNQDELEIIKRFINKK